MSSIKDQACIVGIGHTPYTRGSDQEPNNLTIQLRAAEIAIADAGLESSQIDGVVPYVSLGIAEEFAVHLGIRDLRYQATSHVGGACPGASLTNAAMAVCSGQADYVLMPGGWYGYSGRKVRELVVADVTLMSGGLTARDYYFPHGLTVPVQWFSLMARLHMEQFGTRSEHFGAVAVASRKHAQMNPNALMRGKPMTMEDYLKSPMIAEPFRLFDCSLEADGAAAFVVTTTERARDLRSKPVYLMGIAQGQPFPADGGDPDRRRGLRADLRPLQLPGHPADRGDGLLQAR
jgi:acetyl-CoA acetyltransferase